ncbi:MAG: RluA family pseudouridine synthase [Caulobacteraceae bacterium]
MKPSLRTLSAEEARFIRSRVIFEDEAFIAFDKPAGLSSQGGRIAAATLDDLLAAFVKPSGARPRLAHRLDRGTSGAILAAKTKPAAAFIGRAVMGGRVKKTYLAILAPPPEQDHGTIDAPLAREEIGREAFVRAVAANHPGARSARTSWRVRAKSKEAALVELSPATGRMHQLRVHMAGVGSPIAGDARYGGALVLAGKPVSRVMLHALALVIPHPAGGTRRIVAPLPSDFEDLATALKIASQACPRLGEAARNSEGARS